ncbi:hypothetical protein M3Y97_00277900 [Aphelenchoides bicaudatus]|nr:hypothetical protein M3Y97_00277900 [Aphelenchoides bicaudatus]
MLEFCSRLRILSIPFKFVSNSRYVAFHVTVSRTMGFFKNLIFGLDAVFAVSVGLILYFFPDRVGDYIFKRETDGVHWHLLRCVGGQILASAAFFRFRNRDPETQSSCYLVRILGFALLLLVTFHARSVFPDQFSAQFATGLIYFGFGIIAVNIVALLVSGWQIGTTVYKQTYVGNALYQLDSLASIAIGMAWVSCPHWLLHRQVNITLDETHAICGRYMGSLFVASHLISTHALHWKQFADRSFAAETRAIVCVFILGAQIWSQIAYKRDWSGNHWVGISLFTIWTVISFTYRVYLVFAKNPATETKTKRN